MEKREAKLYPTELGFLVTDLLVEHFQDIMNVEYTAAMEAELDEIEEGKDNLLNTLNQFWKKFEKDLKKASKEMKDVKRMEEQTDEVCDKCGKPMVIKWGRYGKFLACSGYPECKNTRQLAGGEGDGGPELHEDVAKEVCPNDGQPMVLKKGRFGPFLACSNYPECKVTKRLVRGAEGKLQVEQLTPIDESLPRVRQAAHVAARPLRPLHRLQRLPQLQVHQEEGSARRSASPARSAARARSWSARAAGAARSTAASAIPSASSPPTTGRFPSPAPTAAARTCWRRRPRRKARSSSAGTRRATTRGKRRSRPDSSRRPSCRSIKAGGALAPHPGGRCATPLQPPSRVAAATRRRRRSAVGAIVALVRRAATARPIRRGRPARPGLSDQRSR